MFRREVAHRLFTQSTENGFLFDPEILGLAERQRITIREVCVEWHEIPGSKLRLFRDSWWMFVGLFRIRRRIFSDYKVEVMPSDNVASMSRSIAATVGIKPAA